MKIKIKTIIAFIAIITLTSICSIGTYSSAESEEELLMPFSYTEQWDTDVKNGRDDYGIHEDKIGIGIDFYTDKSSAVIAPISGEIEIACISENVTGFNIIRSNGKKLRLLHLLNDTIS
ncbi:MAG: hypothetical protein ACRCXZ_09955, partial [Patescibacteria group bacterium]